jgi:hypothetical protein
MESTTLRVRPHTRDRLNRLAREDNVTAAELLERLVEQEEHARMLRAMNEDFAALRADEAAWREFRAETAFWDAAADEA